MLDMPVPCSFWNIGYEISGQEDSGYVTRCGSNWGKIEEAQLKISLDISTGHRMLMKKEPW